MYGSLQIEHNMSETELVDILEKSAKAIREDITRYKPFPDQPMVDLEAYGVECFRSIMQSMMNEISNVIL